MRIGGWLPVVVWAACGSNAPTGYAGFVAQGRDILCQHQVDCGFADAAAESQCAKAFTPQTLDQSQINYDSAKAAACLAAIKGALHDCHANIGISLESMM